MSGSVTRSVEDGRFVTTGLAKVQREALLLNIEAGRTLRDPDYDEDALALHRELLGNELRLQTIQVADTELNSRLENIAITLDRYDAMMVERSGARTPADALTTAEFDAVFADLERQVMSLYDDAEQSFFFALSRNLRSNQNLLSLIMVSSALVLVGGGALGVSLRRTVGACRNEMRQRNRAEVDLRAANEQIVRSEKLAAIGQWSGGVAHDLRNPLGAIRNAAYLLNRKLASDGYFDANPKLKQYLGIIERQVTRSNEIISDLMTSAGVGSSALTEIQLDNVLEKFLETMVKNDNIVLSLQIDAGLCPVMADEEQLQRVFLNLANNAQEAMPGGGHLTITAASVNEHIEISFIDTGQGISEENIGQIFDPLFTTKTKGTGLGLAVCQEIISRHGGTISARRNEGPAGGTTFEVRLPASGGEVRDEGETEHDS